MQNVELKARLRDRTAAAGTCEDLGATHAGTLHQVDTYFFVPRGRLKLREMNPGDDYLVYYRRDNVAKPRPSEYFIALVDRRLKRYWARRLGVVNVVEKTRELWLWKNVRIHLDRVTGLGDFIEFEAVARNGTNTKEDFENVARLMEIFRIDDSDRCRESYTDLMPPLRTAQ